jgi:hypothetical protein
MASAIHLQLGVSSSLLSCGWHALGWTVIPRCGCKIKAACQAIVETQRYDSHVPAD